MKKFVKVLCPLLLAIMLLTSSIPAFAGVSENPADKFENKELNIAIFEGGYGPGYWNEIVALFEAAYPGVKVNMQISPVIGDIIRPQIVAGNVPDFLSMNDNDQSGVVASLIKENGLLEITGLFDELAYGTETALKDLLIDGILSTTKCAPYGDGKVYLAPFNTSPMGMVYNKALFEANGWVPPVTWDEFFALGDKAKEKGIALFTYQGIYPGYLESTIYPAIASQVGADGLKKIMRFEEGSFNNEKVLAVLANLQKIGTEGYLMEGTVALNHTQSQTDMMNNKALFIPNGLWMEGEMKDAPRAEGFVFGMTPSPVMEAGDQRFIMDSVEQFSIPADAKNPELAKEFLRFLYTDESVRLFGKHANGVMAVRGAIELVKEYVSEGTYSMFSVYADSGAAPLVTGWDALPQGSKVAINNEFFAPITDIMNGTITVQAWAEEIEGLFAQIREDAAKAGN